MIDSLKRVQEKREEIAKSGSARKPLPSCKYFSQLQFVYDKLQRKKHSNIIITSETLDFSEVHHHHQQRFQNVLVIQDIQLLKTVMF